MMNEHDVIRRMLTSAAVGSLDAREQTLVEQHARGCDLCRRELEVLGRYVDGLGVLPQPMLPAGLLERTYALAQERRVRESLLGRDVMLGLLAVLSWVTGMLTWMFIRAVVKGSSHLFQISVTEFIAWSTASTILAWITAGVAAVLISRHKEWVRREL